ncbi:MAG: putative metal-dependent hydrolase [Bacteroidota bacterium]|nr:putative metal-dependent hydrolase [Bacteroidota bacterium]
MDTDHLRFPIGQWKKPLAFDIKNIRAQINAIEHFPSRLNEKVNSFTALQLEQTYRPGGWTALQVIHHCSDSHMNAFIRFKLALTENNPTIKPYAESKWAELPDAKSFPATHSVQLLEALHARWTVLLKSLDDAQWQLSFIHPEHNGELRLYETVSLYGWHCEHHFAHLGLIK